MLGINHFSAFLRHDNRALAVQSMLVPAGVDVLTQLLETFDELGDAGQISLLRRRLRRVPPRAATRIYIRETFGDYIICY